MKFNICFVLLLVISGFSYSQNDSSLILGKTEKNNSAAVFDLSDPTGVNMEVNLWGYVRYPGRYRVPIGTTFMDLISYSGGPTDESKLVDMRIIRDANDQTKAPKVININYEDILWGEQVSTKPKMNPVLQPGDVVVVQKERRYTFRDDLSVYFPIITTLISIATFILLLGKP